jgi:hypothetical protein
MVTLDRKTAKETALRAIRTDAQLRGGWLLGARGLWIAVALFDLVLFLLNLLAPIFGGKTVMCPFTFTCTYTPTTLQILQYARIPLSAYNTYVTVFGVAYTLIFVGISVLLFWRTFDQLAGLLASVAFLFIGFDGTWGDSSTMPLAIQVFVYVIQTNGLLFCLGFFLVTFPDGHFVPRWSWLIGCTLFVQGILWQLPAPLNIPSWPPPIIAIELVLAYGSPIAIQIYRYVRVSSQAQRQQTRWVIFGLFTTLLLLFIAFFSGGFFPPLSLYQLTSDPLAALAFLLIPLSITIAILRSRLWDIDALINRALVYGLLTLLLALVYLGLVFGAQALLVGLIGKNDGIVIVGSTLIVAVLFQPLRRGIQNTIDRRFYRQKYDAQRTLQAFSATLHQEIDLAQLSEQIVMVVQKTVQPAYVSLWLFKPRHQALPLLPTTLHAHLQETEKSRPV